jgi:TonB-dependent receptor
MRPVTEASMPGGIAQHTPPETVMFFPSRAVHSRRQAFRATHVAAAVGLLLGGTGAAFAQQVAAPAAAASAPQDDSQQQQPQAAGQQKPQAAAPQSIETVVVTGLRHSMDTSLSLKRDARGIVDGIVAEDIGKFPDTNLAEAAQRVSGVSIDRSLGEGSKVTVRGVGPDFNLVLMNGRQMPGVGLQATSASSSRSFDFANLAAESISAMEVYKTSRASTPTGGLGATINIETVRPLDNPGLHSSLGVKAVYDQSNDRLPSSMQSSKVTPELSGIYSNTLADGKIGVALAGSYQVRHLGYDQAGVPAGWRSFKGDTNDWGTIPQSGQPGSENITNRPGPNDIYSVPQDTLYEVNGIKRERTNGLLTLQYQPNKDLTATLDYVFSQNKLQWKHNELSAWYNFGPSISSWTNGPVSGPLFYEETIPGGNSDVAMAGAEYATKNVNNSLGVNLKWKASPKLSMSFDAHHSTAVSEPDSPYGSNAVLGTAQFNRGDTRTDFSQALPVLSIANAPLDPQLMQVTGSSFRNSYQKGVVDQGQYAGKFKLDNGDSIDFGLALTNVSNRSAYTNVDTGTWGGATSPADYPDTLWHPDTLSHYFSSIPGSGSSALYNQFFTWDFNAVRSVAAQVGNPSNYVAPTNYDAPGATDERTTERSRSAYVQYNTDWEWHVPMGLAAGLRFEHTDVASTALVPAATGVTWGSNNEFKVLFGDPTFTTLKGSYSYLLPSLDFDADLTDQLKFRASYGETIGRPKWNDIQGGQSLDGLARVDGGTGHQGNPALKPLKSKNFDLSLEFYYAKHSYVAVGYFSKNIANYTGQAQVAETPFPVHTPVNGAWWNEAVSTGGCTTVDTTCIRDYIYAHYNGVGGVTKDSSGNIIIPGQPTDPIMSFNVSEPVNADSARLWGTELNWQHMFANSGFGIAANYTYVNSGLKYKNDVLGDQFALPGLSNSANLVGFYENDKYQVRLAYNWRGEFLVSTVDGGGNYNPVYQEAYAQLDLSTSYNINDHMSVAFDAFNLTDAYQRSHERTTQEVVGVSQTGRRYTLGLNYKF